MIFIRKIISSYLSRAVNSGYILSRKIYVFFEAMRRYRTCGGFLPTRNLEFFLTTFIHARSNSAVGVKPRHRTETISIRRTKVIRSVSRIRSLRPSHESVVYSVINGAPHPRLALSPTEHNVNFICLTVHFVSNTCVPANDYGTNVQM